MRSEEVEPDQATKLASWLAPTLVKLTALRDRMNAVEFPADDALMRRVESAVEAVRQLRLAVHELERPEQPQWQRARDGQARSYGNTPVGK